MYDLLGLEYINTSMCHYLKREVSEAEECSMLHSVLSSQKKTRCFTPSICCKKLHVFMCVRTYKRRKEKRYERTCLIALFKCHFTARYKGE